MDDVDLLCSDEKLLWSPLISTPLSPLLESLESSHIVGQPGNHCSLSSISNIEYYHIRTYKIGTATHRETTSAQHGMSKSHRSLENRLSKDICSHPHRTPRWALDFKWRAAPTLVSSIPAVNNPSSVVLRDQEVEMPVGEIERATSGHP